tara:strand:+ start:177 stop:407 length:231 start_codon:yes stop_codon:yes gene_type:complete
MMISIDLNPPPPNSQEFLQPTFSDITIAALKKRQVTYINAEKQLQRMCKQIQNVDYELGDILYVIDSIEKVDNQFS